MYAIRSYYGDRLALIASNLNALGVEASAEANTLWVTGTDRPPVGRVVTAGDHRIAMAFAILGTLERASIEIDDLRCADVSFPRFLSALEGLSYNFV